MHASDKNDKCMIKTDSARILSVSERDRLPSSTFLVIRRSLTKTHDFQTTGWYLMGGPFYF